MNRRSFFRRMFSAGALAGSMALGLRLPTVEALPDDWVARFDKMYDDVEFIRPESPYTAYTFHNADYDEKAWILKRGEKYRQVPYPCQGLIVKPDGYMVTSHPPRRDDHNCSI